MQVFIPDSRSLAHSARCLDKPRAGNQCWRESKTLLNPDKWPHHPAHSLFPPEYVGALALYNVNLIEHVYEEGWCQDSVFEKWYEFWVDLVASNDTELPTWWGDERVHSTHRGVLLFKNPEWFSQFGWTEDPLPPDPKTGKFPYVWPCELEEYNAKV